MNWLFKGDCRDLFDLLPSNSVDSVVTDPPPLLADPSPNAPAPVGAAVTEAV